MAHFKLVANIKGYDKNRQEGIQEVEGFIYNESSKRIGGYISSDLDWLERDLLRIVGFNPNTDTYEKNW